MTKTTPLRINESDYEAAKYAIERSIDSRLTPLGIGKLTIACAHAIIRSWESRDATTSSAGHLPLVTQLVALESAAPDAGEVTTEEVNKLPIFHPYRNAEDLGSECVMLAHLREAVTADIIANVDRATAGLRERVAELERERTGATVIAQEARAELETVRVKLERRTDILRTIKGCGPFLDVEKMIRAIDAELAPDTERREHDARATCR